MAFSGEQRKQLHSALCAAFPERPALAQMVRFGLDVSLPQITEAVNLTAAVYDLIEWTDAQGRLGELIKVAIAANPANPELRAFAGEPIISGIPNLPGPSPSGVIAAAPSGSAPVPSGGVVNSGQMGNVNTGSGAQTNIGTIQTSGGAAAVGPQATVYDQRQTHNVTQVLPAPVLSPQEQQNRRRMIARVRATWIAGVLEQSLYAATRVELGLQVTPDAVADPWRLVREQRGRPAQALRVGTSISQVYDQTDGSLLILGAPGSGKTTLLLTLGRDLIDRADRDETQPIPVVFHLAAWAEKRTGFADWLVMELRDKYQVPTKVGQTWVGGEHLLLLLDGLDEVAASHRGACVQAINAYRQDHGLVSLVVCSRYAEYKALPTVLVVGNAVVVQPLTSDQIAAYLIRSGPALATVPASLATDPDLRELLDTPLMLNVLALAYAGVPAGTDIPTTRQQILAAYVQRMLTRRAPASPYTPQQTQQWLGWLARHLVAHHQPVFYIERLQPTWLGRAARIRYRELMIGVGVLVGALVGGLGVGLAGGLGVGLEHGLGLGLDLGLRSGVIFGLVGALAVGLVGALVGGLRSGRRITLAETLAWSWERMAQHLRGPVVTALLSGLIAGLSRGLNVPLSGGLISGLVYGLGVGLFGGLGSGLVGGPTSPPAAPSSGAGGLRTPQRRGVMGAGLAGALAGALASGVRGELVGGLAGGLAGALGSALGWRLGRGLVAGWSLDLLDDRQRLRPNQGIWQSARHGLLVGLGGGLGGGLIVGLVYGLGGGVRTALVSGLGGGLSYGLGGALLGLLVIGLGGGPVLGLVGGWTACLAHGILRYVLWRAGALPRNLVPFLDYATERILLRKVGGGYLFINRLLLEYFADLDKSAPNSTDPA